ncbi:MAG: ABC transporter substrate-binding protein [Betaproteobacteria bacterium]|nr:MAG: ABC transporter substrate-binding protein [Betaproteobacteria bacterium]
MVVQTARFAVTGLICAALSLAGTLSAAAAELRIGLAADVTSLDPHFLNVAPNNNAAWQIFDALVHVDANARLAPGLALSWRAIDPTTWEFKLRKGVKFHDGSDFTAEDVMFSLERPATLAASPGPFTGFVKPIAAKKIIDPWTIQLKTAAPYAMLLHDLNSIFIVSKKAAAGAATEDFNSGKAAVGTGPYKLVRFARGERIELARNDAYWGGPRRAAWDKVTLRILPADSARIAALLAGDLDAIENIPTADLTRLKTNANFRLEQKVSWRTMLLHLDQYRDHPPGLGDKSGKQLAKNPFKDARVRLAMSKAINRRAIVERVMEGHAIAAGNLVSPPVFGHVDALNAEAYDPETAKRLLAEAGFPDGFALTLHAPNDRYVNDEQVAQAVAQMLARVGIQTKVETMPASVYFAKARAGEFAFALLGWGSFSGDLALRALLATANADKGYGAWNWGRYSNPKVDALLEQGFATLNETKREALARAAATLALKDVPLILLHHQLASWAMKKDIAYSPRTDEYTFARDFRPN